ncbi:MAG TPA: pyridoxamine 5'-phosphate oxidase family protein [Candidatus Syntrophoarchaeum butanivorans]|uniref:Pyridoxamine 5'-phosphate oxidase n=1 Tax=Candidatus Syntropharchaeum butanivorans TaxID=1839936 RepID=A0A1F2P4Q3_9EURY|nr:MAG: pyridoxamine 5'-phosphate oxidase [Candidatus Syntrophoarchaeum butanivorans]HEC56861.1 pyridoxamine 5'-phosphate oxidase family protein [Candidatus Syntrophoarchaeum butanivorans]
MVKMPKEVKDMIGDPGASRTLATVDADGMVNCVPIGTFSAIDDETIVFADVFLGKTKENLEATKKASVTAWKGMNGYQVKGEFQGFQTSGDLFEKVAKQVKDALKLDIKAVGTIKAKEIYDISVGPDAGKKIA